MDTSECRNEQEEIIDDWSHLINALPNDKHAGGLSKFSQHSETIFPLDDDTSSSLQMTLRCVYELTPLDMLDLYHGRADATGNRIWMGALLFIEAFVRPLSWPEHGDHLDDGASSDNYQSQARAFWQLRMELFDGKQILELGTGTGASGIAIALGGAASEEDTTGRKVYAKPSIVTLTDSDPNALLLCQQNCEINLDSRRSEIYSCEYVVHELEWGSKSSTQYRENLIDKHNVTQLSKENPGLAPYSQDTIIATDVIYDLSALGPLLETTQMILKQGGYFILSHIPRASVDWDISRSASIGEALEMHIVDEAAKYGLKPLLADAYYDDMNVAWCRDLTPRQDYAIRPRDLSNIWEGGELMSSNEFNYEEIDSVGGSIIIFVKKDVTLRKK